MWRLLRRSYSVASLLLVARPGAPSSVLYLASGASCGVLRACSGSYGFILIQMSRWENVSQSYGESESQQLIEKVGGKRLKKVFTPKIERGSERVRRTLFPMPAFAM